SPERLARGCFRSPRGIRRSTARRCPSSLLSSGPIRRLGPSIEDSLYDLLVLDGNLRTPNGVVEALIVGESARGRAGRRIILAFLGGLSAAHRIEVEREGAGRLAARLPLAIKAFPVTSAAGACPTVSASPGLRLRGMCRILRPSALHAGEFLRGFTTSRPRGRRRLFLPRRRTRRIWRRSV